MLMDRMDNFNLISNGMQCVLYYDGIKNSSQKP